MIEGKVEIAGHTFSVQDGELMVYIPDGEGDSELVGSNLIEKLTFLLGLVRMHFEHDDAVDVVFEPDEHALVRQLRPVPE